MPSHAIPAGREHIFYGNWFRVVDLQRWASRVQFSPVDVKRQRQALLQELHGLVMAPFETDQQVQFNGHITSDQLPGLSDTFVKLYTALTDPGSMRVAGQEQQIGDLSNAARLGWHHLLRELKVALAQPANRVDQAQFSSTEWFHWA